MAGDVARLVERRWTVTTAHTGPWPALGRPARQAGGWTVRIVHADDGFTGLAAEWAELYRRCRTATPFQSYHWLRSWWRSYGEPGALRLVLVRRHGELVAAAALMRGRRHGLPVLLPVGDGISDYCDVLVADEWREPALRALTLALLREPGWAALDLGELRPGAAAGLLADLWPLPPVRLPGSLCSRLAVTEDGMPGGLSAGRARKYRRALRRLDGAGVRSRAVAPGEAAAAITTMLRLHEEQWRGRGMTPEHGRPRFARHLAEASAKMIAADQADLTEFVIDGEVVAADLVLIGHDSAAGYLFGARPDLRDRVDVFPMLLSAQTATAARHGLAVADMLRGEEQYKEQWPITAVRNERLVLAGRSPLARPYAALARAEHTGRALAREHAPWLRAVRTRLRGLRAGVTGAAGAAGAGSTA